MPRTNEPKAKTARKRVPKAALESWREVKEWESRIINPPIHKKALDLAGKPFEWAFDKLPGKATDALTKTIEGLFGLLIFTSKFSFSNNRILRKIEKASEKSVRTRTDFWKMQLPHLKKVANYHINENNLIAALEGASCGLGGFTLIFADIPLLFGIAFRTIQQIGESFGFDTDTVQEKRFAMLMIDFSSTIPTAAKVRTMIGKQALKNYARKTALRKMEKTAAVKIGRKTAEEIAAQMLRVQGRRVTQRTLQTQTSKIMNEVSKDGAKALAITTARKTAEDAGANLTRKKLLQLIPLLGGVVGAGFNFWFISHIGETAYYSYLKRHLNLRYGLE